VWVERKVPKLLLILSVQQDGREKFLESVKQDAAKQISDAEEPFRDSVESGQTIGGATSELQFGMQDGKSRG
jgi:hypothetical protein